MKPTRLLIILASIFLIAKFLPAHGQTSLKLTHTRLYIPTSSYTTILKDNDNYYLLAKDYLSSTKAVVNGQGKVEENQSYYPYGSSYNLNLKSDNLVTDKLFTGHRQLDDLNIYHFGARFYSPITGLFIQPDTVEGPNRFSYVANNPVMYHDATGHAIGPNLSTLMGNYPNNPTPCLSNIVNCVTAYLDQYTGIPSIIATVSSPDPNSKWFRDNVEDTKQYISRSTAMTNQAVAMVQPMAVVGTVGKTRTYESVIKSANEWFRSSPSVEVARQEMELGRRGQIVNPGHLQSFFQAIRDEGVRPIVDSPGKFAPSLHTSLENQIRTLDKAGERYLIIHPTLNSYAIQGQPFAYDEIYMHGVHDLGAVQLGFHTLGHPHQGLATGFHAADYWFQKLINLGGDSQLRRFLETRAREFRISP